MEIGYYLQLLRRRWWLAALPTLAALLVAGFLAYRGASAYKATLRVAVSTPQPEWCVNGRAPGSPNGLPPAFYDCNYYAWLTSEYLADDLSELVRSRAFAEDVVRAMGENPDSDSAREMARSISDVVRARKTHRILTITVTANEFVRAQRIGNAIVEVLRTQPGKYISTLATQQGQVVVIDEPQTQRGEGFAAVVAEILARTLMGLLFGLALIFALDLLDPTVRDARDVERTLGLPVLGEIPGETSPRRRAAVPSG